jgi:Protein of unknown function (DUF1360)
VRCRPRGTIGARASDDLAVFAVLGTFATWRVAHLLSSEDGPLQVVARLRAGLGSSELGRLVDCFQCLSIWVALPVAAMVPRRRPDQVLIWMAVSGAACLIELLSARNDDIAQVFYEAEGGYN